MSATSFTTGARSGFLPAAVALAATCTKLAGRAGCSDRAARWTKETGLETDSQTLAAGSVSSFAGAPVWTRDGLGSVFLKRSSASSSLRILMAAPMASSSICRPFVAASYSAVLSEQLFFRSTRRSVLVLSAFSALMSSIFAWEAALAFAACCSFIESFSFSAVEISRFFDEMSWLNLAMASSSSWIISFRFPLKFSTICSKIPMMVSVLLPLLVASEDWRSDVISCSCTVPPRQRSQRAEEDLLLLEAHALLKRRKGFVNSRDAVLGFCRLFRELRRLLFSDARLLLDTLLVLGNLR